MPLLQTQVRYLSHSRWILGAGAAVLVAAFYVCGYHRLIKQWSFARTEIALKRNQLTAEQFQVSELPKVAAEVDVLRQKLSSAKQLTENQDLGRFIRSIRTFATESSLKNMTVQPGVPRQGGVVSEIPVSLSFKGDFLAACEFLRKAEALPRLLSVENLNMQATDSAAGSVDVQLSMNLYFAEQP